MNNYWKNGRMSILSMVVIDVLIVVLSVVIGYLLKFDLRWSGIPENYTNQLAVVVLMYSVISVVLYSLFGLYRVVWRYTSLYDILEVILAVTAAAVANGFLLRVLNLQASISAMVIGYLFILTSTVFSHSFYRFIIFLKRRVRNDGMKKNIMIIGAGNAGRLLHREFTSDNHLNAKVQCFIDDNPSLWGKRIEGVLIVGGRDKIVDIASKLDISMIVFAIPSISAEEKKDILNKCNQTNCELKTLPGIYQLVSGEVTVNKLRQVDIEDLLGRDSIEVDDSSVAEYVNDKVVLVTGGGGSIGSELCRQIAKNGPRKLIIVDIYENNAYDVQMELVRKHPQLDLIVLIASVRDSKKIDRIFSEYRPDIVFHAAAHKHVPLMETSPDEAVKNNVFGTLNVSSACDRFDVSKMVLISSDKAVNPTNIMGATKRLCEMVVQSYDKKSQTSFVAVRFGNVLGSNGSVIPLFRKQIAEGGPITVTDKRIIRYFMTVSEAVSLVLLAGAFAEGGEIFVLDMGTPVKIYDMARNLIRLSGLKPDEDIKIEFTGLRPGEKLYEELLMDEEGLNATKNKRIFIGKPIEFNLDDLSAELKVLESMADDDDPSLLTHVMKMVPTYTRDKKLKRG